MAVSKRVRFEVFKRDAFTCRYCGRKPPEVMLHCDHVVPVAADGPDDPANLVTSCVACNLGKSDKPLGQIVPDIDELVLLEGMQEALEAAVKLRQSIETAKALREATDEIFDDFASEYNDALGGYASNYIEERSVRTFLRKGLTLNELVDALDSTVGAKKRNHLGPMDCWRYFCGVCWSKIRERGATS